MTTSVNHSTLASLSNSAVRVFLKLYDRYATIIVERTRQLSSDDGAFTEPCRLVSLKFCVDVELLESTFYLGFIEGVISNGALHDETLRS